MAAVQHIVRSGDSSAAFRSIVVLDGATLDPGDNPFDDLAALGPVTVYDRTPADLVVARAAGADVVLTNKTPVGAAALAALPELRLVCVLATGVNVVDLAAAARQGVTVCNVPAYSPASVAQHTFALILECTNAVGEHAAAVAAGEWAAAPDFSFWKRPLRELDGTTIGVVGYGSIGSRVGGIAAAFGMKVLAHSPSRRIREDATAPLWSSIEEIFARSDVVTLHCPLTTQNLRFVGAALLSSMKPGSILVNTARGDLIDEAALAAALDAGRPSFAALDVVSKEPPPASHPLIGHPRCMVTPHIAWASLAARRRLMQITAANLRAFADGKPQNTVS